MRYYGFLSNRERGELLPKVYEALEIRSAEKTEAAEIRRSDPTTPGASDTAGAADLRPAVSGIKKPGRRRPYARLSAHGGGTPRQHQPEAGNRLTDRLYLSAERRTGG